MTYRCTKCDWKGRLREGKIRWSKHNGWGEGLTVCPDCGSDLEDLDLAERIAIRMDAGQSEEEATEKAKVELKRWREEEKETKNVR